MEELRKARDHHPDYPSVLLFFPSSLKEGEMFFRSHWTEARAVADAEGSFFKGLGVSQASLRELMGPGVWLKALKTIRAGHTPGRPIGNPWLMPAVFFVLGRHILWEWTYRNIGDNPDFRSLTMDLEKAGQLAMDAETRTHLG